MDYVGSGKVRRALDPNILSIPTSSRRLSLPTAGVVFVTISSMTGFAKWHAFRGGWVCYVHDFLETWSGFDLIIGASSGAPIKRGAVEAIGAATPISKVRIKRSNKKLLKELSLKKVLRVLRLAFRLRTGRLQNPRHS